MKPPSQWPIVAMLAVGLGAFVGIYQISEPQDRSALLAIVAPAVSAIVAAYVGRLVQSVRTDVQEVKKIVNGNTERLLVTNNELARRVEPVEGSPEHIARQVDSPTAIQPVMGRAEPRHRLDVPPDERRRGRNRRDWPPPR